MQPAFHNASIVNEFGTLLGRISDKSEFATIDSLVVKTWRQGHGGSLLKAFEATVIAAKKTGVVIDVYCHNTNAIDFWLHQGFEKIGQSCDGYIEMVKRFTN